jgi:hypothetical protein
MDSRTQNHISMIATCLQVAQEPAHKIVWEGTPPLDFGADIALLANGHAELLIVAAQWEQATGGAADAKSDAEANLEKIAHLLARAAYNHFKKSGDLDRAGKLNYSKSEIVKLRAQELINTTTAIRDLANQAALMPDAAARGVTAERVIQLTQAISKYAAVMSTPRGQIVNRSTLGKEIAKDTAALLQLLRDLDDLVIQFADTAEGDRFVAAWKRARIIVDAGSGHSPPATSPPLPSGE